jgi:hypothetical protein
MTRVRGRPAFGLLRGEHGKDHCTSRLRPLRPIGGARLALRGSPAKPWQHDGCAGAGARCICNPEGAVPWQHVYAEAPTDKAFH